MRKVNLEMDKLLGFRIVAKGSQKDAREIVLGAKTGQKVGEKRGIKGV